MDPEKETRDDILREVGPAGIEALAEAWASMSRDHLEDFRREREQWLSTGKLDRDAPDFTGRWEGYTADAEEVVRRLRERGFTIVPMAVAARHFPSPKQTKDVERLLREFGYAFVEADKIERFGERSEARTGLAADYAARLLRPSSTAMADMLATYKYQTPHIGSEGQLYRVPPPPALNPKD